jgi:divalent metal cation (Fe/Co/Zn/Cd) transporter
MKLEIKNVSYFFMGIMIFMIGIFIVIYDYPQIKYFDNFEFDSYLLLDEDKKNIHQRLKIEFSIGLTFLLSGIGLIIFSLIKKTKGRK